MIKPGAIALFVLGLVSLFVLGDFVLFGIFIGAGVLAHITALKTPLMAVGGILTCVFALNVAGYFIGFSIPLPFINMLGPFQQIGIAVGGAVMAYYGWKPEG